MPMLTMLADFEAVTGWCECTGAIAPLLGGGHGLLQGQYGLLADNLISAQLVLANGTTVTASSTSHPDLFWAIRGAGHNFGVVTKIEYKIYDVPADDSWTYSMFIFTGDKVEAVFEQMNKMTQDENEVAEIINYSLFAWNPAIDSHGVSSIFFTQVS
jgi:FAD/FMN-containing dehydrogenase